MTEVSEYIGEIVNEIDTSIVGVLNDQTQLVEFCHTKWARVGKRMTDQDGNIWLITDVQTDQTISALCENLPLVFGSGTYYLNDPFFITGTKMATNREWTLANNNLIEKTPLIWLLEVISETGYGRGSALERDMELRIFFLDETDPSQYYTKDHREQVVKPMQGLMSEFIKTIGEMKQYKTIETYRYKTFSRFGKEQDNGMFENILDANLSGVALEITLTRYKENCKC